MKSDKIIEQAIKSGYSRNDLKVLSTDPYLVGSSESETRNAEWVGKKWDEMMAQRKKQMHLRGFHYWLMSKRVRKPDKTIYADKDSAKDWHWLLRGAQVARYLNIGQWKGLVDFKHPEPSDYDIYSNAVGLSRQSETSVEEEILDSVDSIPGMIKSRIMKLLPEYREEGYQTYHMEVWCEKNSMGFVIEPVCRKFKATYQALIGQSSIERVSQAADRAIRALKADKKVRIWYIADWDRYGWSMVSAVARKLEYFVANSDINTPDIKLTRLALNEEQILKFNLPKAPKHGEAVVELDAMEAIHPGELGKIITTALSPYVDTTKTDIVRKENERMKSELSHLIENKLLLSIQNAMSTVDLTSNGAGFTIDDVMNSKFIAPSRERKVIESNDWMFDSSRPWITQLDMFKKYKTEREEESV